MSDSQERPKQTFVPTVRVPDFKTVYANSFRFRVMPHEITVSFGFIDEVVPGTTLSQESVSIVMHPATLKGLAEILTNIVRQFEGHFGEIPKMPSQPIDGTALQTMMNEVMARQTS